MMKSKTLATVIDGKRVLLVHHWDADGIASAAILMEELKKLGADEIKNDVPVLGEFEMSADWIIQNAREPPDILVSADISIPLDNLLAIRDGLGVDIVMFDHHTRPVVNEPGIFFINYCSLRDEDWPSNTLVLNDFFGREPDLLSALGLVGDKGRNIEKYAEIWPKFSKRLQMDGYTLEDVTRIVDLLDSCYKSGRRDELMKWPWLLVDKDDKELFETVLSNELLNSFLLDIENKTQQYYLRGLTKMDGYYISEIDTEYHIISALTRRFSNANPDREVMVTNRGMFPGKVQVYLRSKRKDLRPLIGMIQDLGQSAGGKVDVVGSIIDNRKADRVLNLISREIPNLPVQDQ